MRMTMDGEIAAVHLDGGLLLSLEVPAPVGPTAQRIAPTCLPIRVAVARLPAQELVH